jgi:uroporphyrinogen-III synthase
LDTHMSLEASRAENPAPVVLVTRPLAQAQRIAATLRSLGYAPLVTPLMRILPTHTARPIAPFDALVVASTHSSAALVGEFALKALPAFAVGERSGDALREAGFTDVQSGGNDRHVLARLVAAQIAAPSRILAVLGEDHHGDWLDDLTASGRAVTCWITYRAVAVPNLSPEAGSALVKGQIGAVLHYSARQAELFVAALDNRGALDRARTEEGIVHVVLSDAVAKPLRGAGIGPVMVAATPDETGLLAALQLALPTASSAKAGWPKLAGADAVCLALDAKTALNADKITGSPGAARSVAASTAQEASAIMSDAEKTGMQSSVPTAATARKARAAVVAEPIAAAVQVEAAIAEAVSAPSETVQPDEARAPTTSMPETASPAMIQPAKRSGFGVLALLLAGLVGGMASGAAILFAPRFVPGLGASLQIADPKIGLLEREIAALKTSSAAAASRADAAAQGLRQLQAVPASGVGSAAPEAIATIVNPLIGPLAERLARLEASPAAAATYGLALTQRLAAVEQGMKAPQAPSGAASAAARLVLVDRVRAALEAGRGFEADLAALAGTGLTAETLKPLEVLTKNSPLRAAMLEQVRQSRRVLAEDTAATSASWGEKLLQLSDSIVQVRRVDETSATTPAGLTASIEQALVAGDIAAAATAWGKLPEPARRATAALGTQLSQRATADMTLKMLGDAAVAALAGR